MHLQSPATLKALMSQRGYSLTNLAQRADCSKAFVSHLLSGRKASCTPALAARIAHALGVPIDVLFLAPVSAPSGRIDRTRQTVR